MVVVIRGACSVGKTAAARSLVHLLPLSAFVECGEMMPWMSDATLEALRGRAEQTLPDLLNAWLVATAGVLDAQGVHLVIDWHFPADSELQSLLRQLDECALPNRVFNLLCAPEKHLERDSKRHPDAQIKAAGIEYFRREGSWVGSPYGVDIDTTVMSPQDAAKTILEHIDAGATGTTT